MNAKIRMEDQVTNGIQEQILEQTPKEDGVKGRTWSH